MFFWRYLTSWVTWGVAGRFPGVQLDKNLPIAVLGTKVTSLRLNDPKNRCLGDYCKPLKRDQLIIIRPKDKLKKKLSCQS